MLIILTHDYCDYICNSLRTKSHASIRFSVVRCFFYSGRLRVSVFRFAQRAIGAYCPRSRTGRSRSLRDDDDDDETIDTDDVSHV